MPALSFRQRIGITLIVAAFVLPVFTFLACHLWVISHPQVPPNQGAMVMAYFALMGSLAVGLLLATCGLFVLLRGLMARK
jgi:hypothetical protein